MPLRVVGMLFGIPEHFQDLLQEDGNRRIRTERGGQLDNSDGLPDGEVFAEFIDWRVDNPTDDLTTELLEAEFEDETGTLRRLSREELLLFMNVVAVAGAETTTRYLASGAARYVTGQQLRIDAGGALKAIPWSA
jgi:cytochrome P450